MKWMCVQDGAREHYAIPRALKLSGRLETLFTEVWAGPVLRRLAFGPLRAMAGRWHRDLAPKAERLKTGKLKPNASISARQLLVISNRIVSWNFSTVMHNARWRLKQAKMLKTERRTSGAKILGCQNVSVSAFASERFLRDGKWFSEKVRDWLARRGTDLRGKIIFSYDTTALELFRWATARGAVCVLGQMDPNRVEAELVREEEQRWPGWADRGTTRPRTTDYGLDESRKTEGRSQRSVVGGQSPVVGGNAAEEYFQRREAEWQLADRIIVNSRWSFGALVQQGVPAEKLAVIPLCFEKSETPRTKKLNAEGGKQKSDVSVSVCQFSASSPLRVLFLGQVILRKGIQYLVEAAKLLQNEPVQFDVVGPMGISESAARPAPANMAFHGRASRDEASGWYERADVFVLPTISDGFAITQIEAMAHGLPVIATPNCGEVVTDGVDGFIVPARDAAALAKIIRRYLAGPELLSAQRAAARAKASQFTLERLARHLQELENELLGKAETRTC